MKLLFFFCALINLAHAEILKPTTDGRVEVLRSTFSAQEILDDWGRIRGLNLTVDRKFPKKANFHLKGERIFSNERLDSYVSGVVAQSGFTLVTYPDSKFVKVLNARDVRYEPLPVYRSETDVPKNHNYAQMVYELKHIDPKDLARNLRPFMSRYGRVIDDSNMIYVADENLNLRRIAKIINFLDTNEYAKSLKQTQELNKKHLKVIKDDKSILDIASKNLFIFLAIFFLLGSIIGFGIRGLLMKRSEGVW